MVFPTPPPPLTLDERQRAALSDCVSSILEDLVGSVASAAVVSAAMDAVFCAVKSSCAGFATKWNDQSTRTITKRLPVEVLTACLGPADFRTRVLASQVSRTWRSALISDRQLWSDIFCPITHHPEAALRRLKELLERSLPLPFRLCIPHSRYANYDACRKRIAPLVAPQIHRLQSYDGPANVFVGLDPSGRPLPTLTSLDCVCESNREEYVNQVSELSAQRLPNLRRLVAPMLRFIDSQPYERLQHLVCGIRNRDDYGDLFRCCPSLITAEFIAEEQPVLLPRGPIPSSIECITIHSMRPLRQLYEDTDADFACLQAWTSARIPRLVLHGAGLVSAISRAFASAHGSALRLDLGREIEIASAPDARYVWEVHTCDSLWTRTGREGEMRAVLTDTSASSISVTNRVIGPFFHARALLPHLVSLKFNLRYLRGEVLSEDADGSHYVEAPNLQHVSLEICGFDSTLGVLLRNFRKMIVYNAELLETLTVDYLGYEVTEDSDCAELARFAKQYIEVR